MKKVKLLTLIIIAACSVNAQKMIQKFTVKVPALNCEECEAIIENRLGHRVDGITGVDAMWKRKIVKFEYAPERIDTVNIKLMLSDLGFDAGDELAEEDAMKKLPECCRRGYVDPKKKVNSGVVVATVTPTASTTTPAVPAVPAAPAKPNSTATKTDATAKPAVPLKSAASEKSAKPSTKVAKQKGVKSAS
jgi:copper chaperone CopZ